MSLTNMNHKRKGAGSSHLNITSMMDIFVIILVFLLYNVSFDTQSESVSAGLNLPTSNSSKNYKEAKIKISMSMTELKVNGNVVMKLTRGEVPASAMEGEKLVPLYDVLAKLKDEEIAKSNDGKSVGESLVMFQADKRIPYKRLDPIMKTAGMAGFPYFWLAVMNPAS